MKQTSVEWLFEKLWETPKDKFTCYSILEQAKAMEKEQIMTAFTQGDIFGADFFDGVNITAENYYNETYKSE
jgi:hypothetical protein